MGETNTRWRIHCFGTVQHVGFRYTALYLAQKLQLTGWVKNLPDGSVVLEAQGSTAQVRKLLIQLKSQPHLHIERAEIDSLALKPEERGFHVRNGLG